MNNNEDCGVAKEIVKVIKINERCKFKNKLIVFTYYLKLFLILSHIIKLFYQTYLIYLITEINLLNHFKLLS